MAGTIKDLVDALGKRDYDAAASIADTGVINPDTLDRYASTVVIHGHKVPAVMDRIRTEALKSSIETIVCPRIHRAVQDVVDARRIAIVGGHQGLDVALWLTEAEAIRTTLHMLNKILLGRPELSLARMMFLLCAHQSDESERIRAIVRRAEGTTRLHRDAFQQDLSLKLPEQGIIQMFKSETQERTFETVFDALPWLAHSYHPSLIRSAAHRPAWPTLFRIMLSRGFSLHTSDWKKRPLLIARSRRTKAVPPEANIPFETDTLEWLARFSSRRHVVSAIRAGHRLRRNPDKVPPDMRQLLRTARWPMKWTASTHYLLEKYARHKIRTFMLCTSTLRLPKLPLQMLTMVFDHARVVPNSLW
jgi:hypothetical protein